ncbi:fibrous sheath CABYR-binding protein isoform X2 [Nothobranchius furzeri]|uniref:fibrous sheath CABYR-binding protein isoform X2 n=1 Tax=Nothobranchius furzeri TaxID=105023 RepID=UPI00390463D2
MIQLQSGQGARFSAHRTRFWDMYRAARPLSHSRCTRRAPMFSCRAAWQRCGLLARRAAHRLPQEAVQQRLMSSVPGGSGENVLYTVLCGGALVGALSYAYVTVTSDRDRYNERLAEIQARPKTQWVPKSWPPKGGDEAGVEEAAAEAEAVVQEAAEVVAEAAEVVAEAAEVVAEAAEVVAEVAQEVEAVAQDVAEGVEESAEAVEESAKVAAQEPEGNVMRTADSAVEVMKIAEVKEELPTAEEKPIEDMTPDIPNVPAAVETTLEATQVEVLLKVPVQVAEDGSPLVVEEAQVDVVSEELPVQVDTIKPFEEAPAAVGIAILQETPAFIKDVSAAEDTPVLVEVASVVETMAPVEVASVVEEIPAPVEVVLVVEETPAPVEIVPVVEEIPAPVEVVLVVEEILAPVEIAPVVEEIPAPVEIVPVVEIPAPVEDVLVAEETPAPVEVVPVVEDTPGPVEVVPVVEEAPTPVEVEPVVETPGPVEVSPIAVVAMPLIEETTGPLVAGIVAQDKFDSAKVEEQVKVEFVAVSSVASISDQADACTLKTQSEDAHKEYIVVVLEGTPKEEKRPKVLGVGPLTGRIIPAQEDAPASEVKRHLIKMQMQ